VTPAPLSAVLAAVHDGAATPRAIAHRTGLAEDVVEIALEELARMGRLDRTTLSTACPSGGCDSCADGCTPRAGSSGALTTGSPRSALRVWAVRR
jgi:hypothetical protein